MAASKQVQTALLTEHFRYTPLTLLDDIINTVNELVFRAINAIEEGFNRQPPQTLGFRLSEVQSRNLQTEAARDSALVDLKQNEIDNGIVQLGSLLNATVDKDFDKFEIYALRNILAVGHNEEADLANWVQLDHYKNLDLSSAQHAPTPDQVQLQRRKLHETQKLNAMLKAEEARNAAVLAQLQRLLGVSQEQDGSPFAFLISSPHTSTSSTSQPLTQTVQYALSQLPALRDLLARLKASLQTLPNARHFKEDGDSVDVKRRHYIDEQSRRAIERKGLDTDGGAKTGAATGRKIGRDEVEGMEAVMQALGAVSARTDDDDDTR